MSDKKLPAGQQSCKPGDEFPVVELDGRPYQRTTGSAEAQFMHALGTIAMQAAVGQVNAMWGIVEVQTKDGLQFAIIRYGVGTDTDAFGARLERLADEHGHAVDVFREKGCAASS